MKRLLTLALAGSTILSSAADAAWVVTHKTNNHSGPAHTVVITGVSIPLGDIAVVPIGMRPAGTGDTIFATDTAGNTYTVRKCPVSSIFVSAVAIGYMTTALVSGSITIADDAAATATDTFADVWGVNGGKTSSIEDTAVWNSGAACASATSTAPSVTGGAPAQAGDLIIQSMQYATGTNTQTPDGAITQVTNTGDANILVANGYLTNAGTSPNTVAPTLLNSKAWQIMLIGLAPAGGAASSYGGGTTVGVGH